MLRRRAVYWLVTINAVVGLAFGAILLLVPQPFVSLNGLGSDPATLVFARLYGAELCGFSVATWLVRTDVRPPRGIVLGHVVNESLTAIVIVLGALAGVGNALVWPLALAPAMFAVGYAILALERNRPNQPL